MVFAVGFGLFAALLFAASASLQQHAAHQSVPGGDVRPGRTAVFVGLWRLIRHLVRRPLWIVGWCVNLVGFGVQAIALHFGSVALVQPVLVTQLLFTLPMAAAWQRRRPGVRDWGSAGLICGGLGVFLAVRGVAPVVDQADRSRLDLGVSAPPRWWRSCC